MAQQAAVEFMPIILEMLRNPPDPNYKILTNRHETIYGVAIPFHILSWVAVGFRLNTRLRVLREPGWDDSLVVLSAFVNLGALVSFFECFNAGLGEHLIYAMHELETTMIWFYIWSGLYTTTTICIKLSLLLQYLRLFHGDYRRTITMVLLMIVILWGVVFSFMSWFPCFPVSGFWDKQMNPPAKCYGFGYRSVQEAKNSLFAFSGSNMILDFFVFLVPLTEYFRPGLKRKQVLAMTALFGLGSIVVIMAMLRLWSGLKYNNTMQQYDFTWWLPEVLLFSSLEVDFAIMCASVPIFWPTVVAAWTEIFVTREVVVTHVRRSRIIDNGGDQLELFKTASMKSHNSTDALTRKSREGLSWLADDPERNLGSACTQVIKVQPFAQEPRIL